LRYQVLRDRELNTEKNPAAYLASEVDELLALLKDFPSESVSLPNTTAESPTLLKQCLLLCEQHQAIQHEPIRTVHHFACTGGTLISKCIAAMPNTQLLSEVDPLNSPAKQPKRPQFNPTNMVALLRDSTRGVSDDLVIELFLGDLQTVYDGTICKGGYLVLRDHAHSHFCMGPTVQQRPSLLEMIATRFQTLSLITVRNPIDSYLSLKLNGWVFFSPDSFDEYCGRYLAFLRAYDGVPIIRFEDFTEEPDIVMKKICGFLKLPFNPQFKELFSVFKITGDSGRSGDVIESRPRREISPALVEEINASENFMRLGSLLGYSA
jgi:hypothetical protein